MRVLAIETSERIGTLSALECSASGNTVIRAATLPSDQRSAHSLLPAMKSLMGDCGWKPSQLELICVTTGPGSFTGLRIGVTTAKTLAYATGAKLVGVHTLAAMVAGLEFSAPRLWAILDAQRQELFVARFEPNWQEQTPTTQVLPVDLWLEQLRPGEVVSGPPLKKLAGRMPEGVRIADEKHWPPKAEQVGQLGFSAFQAGHTIDPMQLVPHYYRKSAAEEKADR